MSKLALTAIFVISTMLLSGSLGQVFALPYQTGDVFVSVGGGQVEQWRPQGLNPPVFVQTLTTGLGGFTTGSAFDSSDNFYVTGFSADRVSQFDNNGALLDANWAITDANSSVESILFNTAGDAYVGQADGTRDILRLDGTNGNVLMNFNVATESRGSDWIDLAADQQTMFYTSEGSLVKRYDVVNDVQLADFSNQATGPGAAFALRLLPAGGLLVADSANIKRMDGSGAVIATYDVSGNNNWFALNLDPDGVSFWSGDFGTSNVCKFNIATGTGTDNHDLCFTPNTTGSVFGLSLFGEITVSQLIGGEILPVDNTALLLAGIQSSTIWMLPFLAMAAGVGTYYLTTRMNKDK